MLSESDEAVEATITPMIEDYRSVAYRGSAVFAWNAALITLLTLGAFLSWAAAQAIGAIILGGSAFLLLVYTYISMNTQLRSLPSWFFAPHTYHISGEGLAISSPAGHRLIRWGAVSAIRKDPFAYWFLGQGNASILLFHRTLSAEQKESIDAAVSRLGGRIGETLDVPARR